MAAMASKVLATKTVTTTHRMPTTHTSTVSAATVPATVLGRCNSWGKSDRCTDCGGGGNANERFSEHGSVSSLERCPRPSDSTEGNLHGAER